MKAVVWMVMAVVAGSLFPFAVGAQEKAGDAFHYEFAQPNFLVSKIEISLDGQGTGKMAYWEKDADPTSVDISLRPETLSRLKGMIEKLTLTPDDLTPSDRHQNLGTTRIAFWQGTAHRETAFTYTPNPQMNAISQFFRGMVTQHQRKSQLEVARRYQPLDTPKILKDLESDLNGNRIAEPVALGSLLKSLSNDERIPLIARNQAKKLFERVGK